MLLSPGRQLFHAPQRRLRFLVKINPSTDTIWAALSADMRQFIRRRVSDEHAADDLLQEVFIRIHRNLGTLQDADRLLAWVYQIARNVIRDYQRKATDSTVSLDDTDPIDAGSGVLKRSQCPPAVWLSEMIAALPEAYRDAVRLAEINGLTQQEMADRFDLTLSGAKSRVQRGRALLRRALDACCALQFDNSGRVLDCEPRPGQSQCTKCGE